MEESSLIPTDAITLTNEDAMDSARTAFPTGGIPDQFTELLIAERQGRILAEKAALAERQRSEKGQLIFDASNKITTLLHMISSLSQNKIQECTRIELFINQEQESGSMFQDTSKTPRKLRGCPPKPMPVLVYEPTRTAQRRFVAKETLQENILDGAKFARVIAASKE